MRIQRSRDPFNELLSSTFRVLLMVTLAFFVNAAMVAHVHSNSVDKLSIRDTQSPSLLVGDSAIPTEGFTRIAEAVAPSVVNVSTKSIITPSEQQQQVPEAMRRFFGVPEPQEPRARRSLGSGVIVDESGYILTNYHVVAPIQERGVRQKAEEIEVTTADDRTFQAKLVGFDAASDLAVLKIGEGETFPAAAVGDSEKLQVGEWVVAIGSPFGLEQTVTVGTISATGRVVPTEIFGGYLQTDAAINPGNSGGPLVNQSGEVVGINTFITSTSGSFAGVGFAVPSTIFVDSYNQIMEYGSVRRGWIGVSLNNYPMTDTMAEFFGVAGDDSSGIKDGDGAVVTELIDEEGSSSQQGPAAKAGIQPGDVIVEFGGEEVEDLRDLRTAVANTNPGEEVPLTVVRDGQVLDLRVTLRERTLEQQRRAQAEGQSFEDEEQEPQKIGLEFRTLQDQEAERVGLDDVSGVVLLNVTAGSLADDAGLLPNQVITHVNGQSIDGAQDFKNRIDSMASGAGIVFRVITVGPSQQSSVGYTSIQKP